MRGVAVAVHQSGHGAMTFAHRLAALYEAAERPTYDRVVAYCVTNGTKVADSSLHDWISGKTVPRDKMALRNVVRYLHSLAKQKSPSYRCPAEHEWEEMRLAAQKERRSQQGRRPLKADENVHHFDQDRAYVAEEPPLGQLLCDLTDPYALEIHPAIEVPGQGGVEPLPVLPTYVPRAHDAQLHELVDNAQLGHSGIGVVIGSSSSGKSRSCWEAIRRLGTDWRIWAPSGAEASVRQLDDVSGKTVIWLDETQRPLLRSPLGERLADKLHELVHAPRRGPVLVLVLLWTEQWNELTSEPRVPGADGHRRVRGLLTGHGIPVPPAFVSSLDRAALAAAAAVDPRLSRAVAEAIDGEIIQYLAGVPVLMERFRTADPGPKALVLAAMDIRRVGHGRDLPLALLEVAAYAYLTESQRHRLARQSNWLQHALDYVEADCRGTLGPLTPVLVEPSQSGHAQHYRLADYLEQHGRRIRAAERIPEGCWEALLTHAPRAELIGLARGAFELYRYRMAIRLCSAAAEAGDNTAFGYGARWLARLGRWKEALPWYVTAASVGDTAATCTVSLVLAESDHWDEANLWFRHAVSPFDDDAFQAASTRLEKLDLDVEPWLWSLDLVAPFGDQEVLIGSAGKLWEIGTGRERWLPWFEMIAAGGTPAVLSEAAWRLAEAGDVEDALLLFRRAVDAGDSSALGLAADNLAYVSRWDEAKAWYEEAVAAGQTEKLGEAAWFLAQAGHLDDALAWFSRAVAAGHVEVLEIVAQCLAEAGRLDEALVWYQKASDAGSEHALVFAAERLGDSGRWAEANAWYERAVAAGGNRAANDALKHMVSVGREEALLWYERAVATGGTKYLTYTAAKLAEQGRMAEALTWFDRAAEAGETDALSRAAEQLDKAGQHQEALEWRKRASAQGDSRVFRWIADELGRAGFIKEALTAYDLAILTGDDVALDYALMALQDTRRLGEDRLSWLERAATAGKDDILRHITWNLLPVDQTKAKMLFSYGWEADGTVAKPWEAPVPRTVVNSAPNRT